MVSDLPDTEPAGYRVMMFRLGSNKQWDVFGVGYLQRLIQGQPVFVINSEDTEKRLMYHRISIYTEYTKQNESIIVFYDRELNMDLAISFQHSDACEQVYEQVQTALKSSAKLNATLGSNGILLDDQDINVIREPDDPSSTLHHAELSVSSPTLSNLEKVLGEIQNAHPSQKNDLTSVLRSTSFLPTLFDAFYQAKDLEAYDALFTTFAIMKSLFFLNSVTVIEMLTAMDTFRTTIDILQYDPSLSRVSQKDPFEIDYNRFTKALEAVQFRNVIPIENSAIVQSIQRNYHLSFIRDVVSVIFMNDNVTQTLNSMVFCDTVNIITPLSMDTQFQERLFRELSNIPRDLTCLTNTHVGVLKFCNELMTLAKTMPLRPEFYARLSQHGLFVHLADILCAWQLNVPFIGHLADTCAHIILEILHTIVALDPQLIRAAMLSEGASSKLLASLLGVITNKSHLINAGVQYQASELLVTLLDTDSIEFCNQKPFVESCLESHLSLLCQCIQDSGSAHSSIITSAAVLITLIREHGNALSFTFKHIHWETAAQRLLSQSVNMQLVLLGVRMVRAAFVQLFSSQTALESFSSAESLLKACVDVFLYNGPHRYNLLHSAVLDLMEYIRVQNIKPSLRYLVDIELPRLQSVSNLPIFEELRVRDQQNLEGDDTVRTSNLISVPKNQTQLFDEMQREESYFDSISNEEDRDVDMNDSVHNAFIERKEMQAKEEQIDFVSTVQRRKKLKIGLKPATISIKRLVSYPIDDDDKESESEQRRKTVVESYEDAGGDISLDHPDVQSVQCEPVTQQS